MRLGLQDFLRCLAIFLLTVYVEDLKWNIETPTIIIGDHDSKIDSLLAVSAVHVLCAFSDQISMSSLRISPWKQ